MSDHDPRSPKLPTKVQFRPEVINLETMSERAIIDEEEQIGRDSAFANQRRERREHRKVLRIENARRRMRIIIITRCVLGLSILILVVTLIAFFAAKRREHRA